MRTDVERVRGSGGANDGEGKGDGGETPIDARGERIRASRVARRSTRDGDGRAAIESRGHRIDVVVQRDARQERDGDERGDGTGGAFEEDDGKDDAKAHDGVESDVRGRGEDVDRKGEERVLG